MATVTTKSTELTNIDAGTLSLTSARHMGSRLRVKSAYCAVAAADDDGSAYRFFRVHSSNSIKQIQIINTAITAGTDWDLGLYHISGGAAVDADLYADGLTLATACPAVPHVVAAAAFLSGRFGDAATAVPGSVNNKVWNDIGTATYASDPQLEFDMALTANTVGTVAGTVALIMYYTAGD